MRKIIFLDYDGVVNTLIWCKMRVKNKIFKEWHPNYNYPSQKKVNNFQAVKWLEKLCLETGAEIVVSSTWRFSDNYAKCLYNGGLSKKIKIIGRTPRLNTKRGVEISKWISDNIPTNEDFRYVILDDDSDMTVHMDKLVKCDMTLGFNVYEYSKALEILQN